MSSLGYRVRHHGALLLVLCLSLILSPLPAAGQARVRPPARAAAVAAAPCTATTCVFTLGVNPGLLAGQTFACPAIQQARASITISNRFASGALNDILVLRASHLPPNVGFDLFLVENSPLDAGTFVNFGFGWYQSDVESTASGTAQVTVRGIFDQETFVENPSDAFNPIHTYNVGFWFDSPSTEQQVCGNATAPAATPFNGEQDAGLVAMITQGEPLQFVQ